MKDTLTELLLQSHLVDGHLHEGAEIGLRIDQALTQDATGTLVYLEFESLGKTKVQTPTTVSYVDHNLIQTDARNADDHRFLQSCAAKYGVVFSPPGNGVSHHVHRQRFGNPGQTLLGSDSHTTTGGCLGMLAMGAGGVEVAMAMAGQPYYLACPSVWGFHVKGRFQPYVSGKDLILTLLQRYSCQAGVGKIMEFYGTGLINLDMSARSTIANMAVDMGFTAAVFPSDEVTRDYLQRNGRASTWRELHTPAAPQWDEHTEVDLNSIEPMVACPSSPDNVQPAAALSNTDVHQVIIGSSCNGSYRDFMVAAAIVQGKFRHPQVSFEINTGSRETLHNVLAAGGVTSLLQAGARLHEAGCLGCIGMGQAPATGTNSLRTFPRNFKGRSGTAEDQVYLCSPETAAASALTGRITDPRTLGKPPDIRYPETFFYTMDWFIPPAKTPDSVSIVRGPNIHPLPVFPPLVESLEATVLITLGDDVSTDCIMPAGSQVLPYRSNIPAISEFVFHLVDSDFAANAREHERAIVIGGENYGQGSSREHAALAPRYLGVQVKIAKSFARIHKANLVNFGIIPLTFTDPADFDDIKPGQTLVFPDIKKAIAQGDSQIAVHNENKKFTTQLNVSERQRHLLLAGGLLNTAR